MIILYPKCLAKENGCQKCFDVCPHGAVEFIEPGSPAKGFRISGSACLQKQCSKFMICKSECPGGAIIERA